MSDVQCCGEATAMMRCYLPLNHPGPHEAVAVPREKNPNYARADVLIQWEIPNARSADRRYFFAEA